MSWLVEESRDLAFKGSEDHEGILDEQEQMIVFDSSYEVGNTGFACVELSRMLPGSCRD